ncbi:MAG: acyl carrier protein [Candidatus Aquilonibacter sp.]
MTNTTGTERLKDIIVEVLRVPRAEVIDRLDMEATSTWDSLSHMQLIAALEDEFAVELTADEIVAMRSVQQIRDVLRSKSVVL